MKDNYKILTYYEDKGFRITDEWRPPGFVGPQNACHPQALEVSVVSSGCAKVSIGGQADRLHAGLYNVVPAGVEHSSWSTDVGVHECNIHFPLPLYTRALDAAGIRDSGMHIVSSSPISPEALHIVNALTSVVAKPELPARRFLIESLSLSLCAWLVGERHQCAQKTRAKQESRPDQRRVRSVEELMRASPERSYSVEELARVAKMGRFRFLRAFKKEFGFSPYAYLLKLRVERGADLIVNTELPITTIALDLGFSSSGRFTDAFKRVYGHPPSDLRQEGCTIRKNKQHDSCSATH